MSNADINFICPDCGENDFGRYCSYCGSSLKPTDIQIPTLLAKSLASEGYDHLAVVNSSKKNGEDLITLPTPHWFPNTILREVSKAFSSFGFSDVELLTSDLANISVIELVAILNIKPFTQKKLSALAELLIFVIHLHESKFKTKGSRINISINFYLIFPQTISYITVDNLCKGRVKPFKTGVTFSVSSIGISVNMREFYPRFIGLEKTSILKSVFAQVHLEDTILQRQRPSSLQRTLAHFLLELPTQELRKFFWIYKRVLFRPLFYASEIDKDKLSLKTALSYLLLLSILEAQIDKLVFKDNIEIVGLIPFPVPFGEEVAVFLIGLFVILVSCLPFHMALKMLGGQGTFEKTFITNVILAVISVPIVVAIDAATILFMGEAYYDSLTVKPGASTQYGLIGAYTLPMLSVVHKISKAKVAWAIGLVAVVYFVVLMLALS